MFNIPALDNFPNNLTKKTVVFLTHLAASSVVQDKITLVSIPILHFLSYSGMVAAHSISLTIA